MMTIEEVHNLIKETLKDWEIDPTYTLDLVEASYRYPSSDNFFISVELQSEDEIVVTVDASIESTFFYTVEKEFSSLSELEEYLKKLSKLNDDDLDSARQEMHDALDSHFRDLL